MKILEIKDLNIHFSLREKKVYALKNVNFDLYRNQNLGIVGESGSGKSVCVQSIVKINQSPSINYSGKVIFKNTDLFAKTSKELIAYRGREIAYIFQDPMTALNPTIKIGKQIQETMVNPCFEKVCEILHQVKIDNPKLRYFQHPHELSGGQCQRVVIAMALAMNPKILIADEPTTALDVSVQFEILKILKEIKKDTSIIFISHNLKLVASLCDKIIVMYAGMIVEEGKAIDIVKDPHHPYTKLLLLSIPSLSSEKLYAIEGDSVDITKKISHCPFSNRCPNAKSKCFEKIPPYFFKKNKVMCWLYE